MPRWSKLSKDTESWEKYKRKACFSFYFRDGVSSAKPKLINLSQITQIYTDFFTSLYIWPRIDTDSHGYFFCHHHALFQNLLVTLQRLHDESPLQCRSWCSRQGDFLSVSYDFSRLFSNFAPLTNTSETFERPLGVLDLRDETESGFVVWPSNTLPVELLSALLVGEPLISNSTLVTR